MIWPWLPLDIYVHILAQLPVSAGTDPSSTNTLLNCCLANTQLRDAAVLSSLWEPHYHARYTICDEQREKLRILAHGDNWRVRYADRRRLDCYALKLLDEIVDQRSDRVSRARTLCHSLSFDVWDVLSTESRRILFEDEDADFYMDAIVSAPYALTRRFWARKMLGVIARYHAIKIWSNLHIVGADDHVSFEESLAGLSAFFGYPPQKILARLDSLSILCREHLIAEGNSLNLDEMDYNRLAGLCSSICAFLRQLGYDAAGPAFHNLFNHFPHFFLSTHQKSIPLSLVYVFVAVAKRLGITASPTNFPNRVMAHVSSPNPEVSDLYVDVYGSSKKAILSARDDIPQLLLQSGIAPASMMRYIAPSTAAPMLLRAARNIMTSLQILPHEHLNLSEEEAQSAAYASYCANMLLAGDERALPYFITHTSCFPLDFGPVLLDSLVPLLHNRGQESLTDSCNSALAAEEEAARTVNRRSGSSGHVKYFIGMLFVHVKQSYMGCITGWEPTCTATEEWILQMSVDDSLERGRHQPFYHVLSMVGPPERYVAEDNIKPLRLTPAIARDIVKTIPESARYFSGVKLYENGWGRMIPSPECKTAYPEDDKVADAWVLAQPGVP